MASARSGDLEHPLAAALAVVGAGVDDALATSTVTLGQADARGLLAALDAQERRLHAVRLRLVAASVAHDRPDATGAVRGARVQTAGWMRSALRVSAGRAAAEVRAAVLLDPDDGDLRELGRELAAGRTSAEHVRVACRAITRVPRHLRVGDRDRLSAVLTEHATSWAPDAADRLAGHLLAVLDPDGSERYDPAALDRRTFSLGVDSTGMVVSRGQHDPVSGAFLAAAVDALATFDHELPHPDGADASAEGSGVTLGAGDVRVPAQRRHDALDTLVRAGVAHLAACDTAGGIGAAMTRLIVTATVDQLAAVAGSHAPALATTDARDPSDSADDSGAAPAPALQTRAPGSATCVGHGPVDSGFLQLAACDAVTDRVLLDRTGAVVSMTSRARYASPALVRALIARDGGCAAPGCPAPPGLTHAHHVRWWSRGGPTEVGNLVLVCGRHHREVHAGSLEVTMRDGVPWFRRPGATGLDEAWHRNTLLDAAHRARRLGQQLAADARLGQP